MKKIITICLAIALVCPAVAQQQSTKKLKLVGSYAGLGMTYDRFQNMSLNQLSQLAENPTELTRDLTGLNEEANTLAAGTSFIANLVFNPYSSKTKSYNKNHEIRLGVGLHSKKESMVSYKSETLDTSVVFCNLNSEITIEGAYILNKKLSDRFIIYAGLAANGSVSVNNEMMIIAGKYFKPGEHPSAQVSAPENIETFNGRALIYSRAFIPWGVHIIASNHLSVGLDFKPGLGMQYVPGTKANFISKSGGFLMAAKFTLD